MATCTAAVTRQEGRALGGLHGPCAEGGQRILRGAGGRGGGVGVATTGTARWCGALQQSNMVV
jgi:hypothetical protein